MLCHAFFLSKIPEISRYAVKSNSGRVYHTFNATETKTLEIPVLANHDTEAVTDIPSA